MYHEQCRIVVLNGTQHRRGIAVQNNPTIAATDPALTIYRQSRKNKEKQRRETYFQSIFAGEKHHRRLKGEMGPGEAILEY